MKLLYPRHRRKPAVVAPRAGAWIETQHHKLLSNFLKSPPARGRGLKQLKRAGADPAWMSPPARGRGLKHACLLASTDAVGRPPRGGVD